MLFGPKDTFQDGNQWTYQIWPVQFLYGRTGHFEKFSIANTGPHWKNQFSSSHTSQDCTAMLFGPKDTFQDGNQWTYQIWPVQFLYGRTGDFEEFSIANTGSPLKKSNFQLTYFPWLYSYAVWTKRHLSRWESMDIPDLTCTVLVRPHRGLWKILYS